ncbi:hypothetical protein [Streptomyces sp. NBC_00503]|uniref:hypothetical protein n=1 Tax=Streptomyces sp. NBC_00503 TaxID=2903659 RepID=UPI002E809EAD|nr:hypothetical protein [Streptomyces sp. NBC_00503]WUD82011.1 hypothetical protein OG490_16480 [Streptomyces sp. NBC_00503]
MGPQEYSKRWQDAFGEAPSLKLASADGGGGAGGDLVHAKTPWRDASTAAGELGTSMAGAVSRISRSHEGLASGTAGLSAAGALAAVQASWDKRLTAIRKECGALEPALFQVAKDIGEVDEQGRAAFSRLALLSGSAK